MTERSFRPLGRDYSWTGYGMMLPVERRTQGHALSAPFNRYHHPMARSRLVEATVMFRRPSAAPPTAPIVAPETPRTWVKVLGLVEPWPGPLPGDAPSSSPGHGVAHSSRKVSLQPYTVTDAMALTGSERSRLIPTWD